MTKERLSKLQKWILVGCYQGYKKSIQRQDIKKFFGIERNHGFSVAPSVVNANRRACNKVNATITRSLKILSKRGYVDLISRSYGSYCKKIKLKQKGVKTARKSMV